MMKNWSFYDLVTELIPFSLKGYSGKVAVYYATNDDPITVGYDSLPGIPFNISLSRGYPVIHARIEAFGGTGYRMFFGWIQIVTSVYRKSHDQKTASTKTFVSVDIAPAFQDSGIPFAAYGVLPQLFDAPCLNLGNNVELTWTADTFLTTVPMRSREEEIERLSGFRWGYSENDLPEERPKLLPLQVTDGQVWNQHLTCLRKEYSHWRFKNA
jgi:hypothetical protein